MELGKSIVRSIQYHMPDIGSYLIFVSFNISEKSKCYLQSSENKNYVIITRQVHLHIRDRILSDYTISGQSI